MGRQLARDVLELADEGVERFKREGCECDRRGLSVNDECLYDDPCPRHDTAQAIRKPTPRQLALAAETIKRYVQSHELTVNESGEMMRVADNLGIAALARQAEHG